MITPGVSIIICCHNGGSRLPETIRHIASQKVPSYIPWEFILVDNGSTDRSVDVASQEWEKYNTAGVFRIVHEPMLGLSHARKKGFQEAKYEFVIMCDDDNWLNDEYVTTAFRIMSTRPKIGALGGYGKLIFETTPPPYIMESNIFAAGEQAPRSGKVTQNRVYGAGCVIRKSAYDKLLELGFKTLLTDRKGNYLSSGGDYELCYALRILGYEIWYDERLSFLHYITSERLTWEYFIRYAEQSSACVDVLSSYKFIAGDSVINENPAVFIGRNFFYFLRKFVRINLVRLFTPAKSDRGRLLTFHHIALKYKLLPYFFRFGFMLRTHAEIRNLKSICLAEKMVKQVSQQPVYPLPFKVTYYSKAPVTKVKRVTTE